MKIAELYDLVSDPSSDTTWCEPRDHVVTQPTTKNEIWFRKAEIGLMECDTMETYPKTPTLLEGVEWRHEASKSSISQIQFVQEPKNARITLTHKLKSSKSISSLAAEI